MRVPPLPMVVRVLLPLFLRGRGSEFVHGDLLERYAEDLKRGMALRRARRRLRRNVVRSLVHWWSPGAVVGRLGLENSPTTARGGDRSRSMRTELGHGEGRLGSVVRDLKIGLRGVMRRPAMAVTVALTLGLGIGATTTIFSVVEGVLLRPLPFSDPSSLVALGTTFPQREWVEDQEGRQHLAGMSVANFRDLEERARSFQALAAAEMSNLLLPDEGQGPELTSLARVSDGFFTLLDVTPAVGLALGVLVALITSRVLEGFLYEVEPNDVGTLVAVGAVLLGVSALASFFPARKATRVDPVDVLNSD